MPLGALVGGALGALGSIFGASKAAKEAAANRAMLQKQADYMNSIRFNPYNVGFNGAGVSFLPGGAQLNLGEFGGLNDIFRGLAPQYLQQGGALQQAAMSNFGNNEQYANALAGLAAGDAGGLLANGFQQGLQQQLFGQAGQLAGQTDFSDLQSQTLELMREQARPEMERAFQSLQDRQFSMGQLGSSGGALQTEAFAKGLANADISRQLAATGVAQQQQAQNANIANMFGGLGGNLAGLESQLMNEAFGRFGSTAGLAADLNQMQFGRGSEIFRQGFQSLAGQQSIMDSILGLGTFGANLGASAAQTQLGGATGAAGMFGQKAQTPGPGTLWGGFATSLGGSLLNQAGGLGGLFSGLFNRSSPQPTILGGGATTPFQGGMGGAGGLNWGITLGNP